jgi:hypothetical protein
MCPASQRLNIQRLGILAIDAIAHTPQLRKIAQALLFRGRTGHCTILASRN